jgi:hypothetical protein
MRWIKHLTLAHTDPAMALILEKLGAEAYGVWWLILEDIAAPMETGKMVPAACHSVPKWASICHCSARAFRTIAQKMSDLCLIDMQTVEDQTRIEVRNILKFKDEYAQRSGQTPDTKEIESRKKAEGEKKTPDAKAPVANPSAHWFEAEFWPAWPVKENKAPAKAAAKKIAPADYPAILAGVQSQAQRIRSMERPIHAATWLNNRRWEDEPPTLFAPRPTAGRMDPTAAALQIVTDRISRGERPLA